MSEQLEILPTCGCITCVDARPPEEWNVLGIRNSRTRMILCELCGNKRCPHATYHKHACTRSNESGQPGSRFGGWHPTTDGIFEVSTSGGDE